MAPLSHLLPGTASAGSVLFRRGGESLTLARMRRDAARLVARLQAAGARRAVLVADDLYAFSVGLLGCCHAQATVVLPPNSAPSTLQSLMQGEGCILLAESALPGAMPLLVEDGPEAPLLPFDAARAEIIFSTSGSSGEPKNLSRTLANLEAEVEAVRVFCPDGGQPHIFSTVSPMHAYGIIFCCLLPLSRAWCVECLPLTGVEGVLAAVNAYPGCSWLVSSPAFLSLWADNIPLYPMDNPPKAILSAGAPLPGAAAGGLMQAYGVRINEVFGCSEAGVMAHRHGPGEPWLPFPGVSIEPFDGGIHVTSAAVGGSGTCDLGDAIEPLGGGRFNLLGRVDRIVKLVDKRLSLAEVESRLAELPEVEAAAAMVFSGKGRARLGVVVVPSAEGWGLMSKEGYAGITRKLRAHLGKHFDPVLLPRKWRFAGALPLNAQSKVDRAALTAMFSEPALLPLYKLVSQSAGKLEFRMLFVPDTPCYKGHFPGYPIVPGVLFVHTMSRLMERYCARRVSGVTRYKFCAEVHPGDVCRMSISLLDGSASIACCTEPDGAKCSMGRVTTFPL